MPRRRHTVPVTCAEPNCKAGSFYEADSVRDATEIRTRLTQRPWRCVRHSGNSLTTDNRTARSELVSSRSGKASGLYWNGTSGFAHGKGWQAFANDFPEGTRIVIEVRVELPDKERSDVE